MRKVGDSKQKVTAFVKGLVEPSLISVALALIIPVMAALTAILAGPIVMKSKFYTYVMNNFYDTHTLATHRILKGVPEDKPSVFILGSSIMVYCIEDGDNLGERLGLPKDMPVVAVPTASQSSYEMAAILDELQPPSGSVVVLGLNSGIFTPPLPGEEGSVLHELVDSPRMAFKSKYLDNALAETGDNPPLRTGVYMIDNADYFLARKKSILKNVLKGGTEYGDPLKAPWVRRVDNQEFWDKEMSEIDSVITQYDQRAAAHFSVLADVMAKTRANADVEFVVFEAPINPGWYSLEKSAAFYDRFHEDLLRFASTHDAAFLDATETAKLQKTDFIDYEGHLRSDAARQRCTGAVAQSIAAVKG